MRRTMFRRTVTAAGVGILALGAACSSPALPQGGGAHEAPAPPAVVAPVGTSVPPSADSSPVPPPQLPLGGRSIFPDHLVIADYGSSGGAALGVLGVGSPDEAAEAVTRRAQLYTSFGRRVQPAMELIATVALNTPARTAPTPPEGTSTRYSATSTPHTATTNCSSWTSNPAGATTSPRSPASRSS